MRAENTPLFLAILAILTILSVPLRSLSLCLAFDADIGYFHTGSALVTSVYVLELAALALCILLFFLINKGEVQLSDAPSTFSLVGAGSATLLSAIVAVYLLLRGNTLPAPALVTILALLSLFAGAAYFATELIPAKPAVRALLGYALLLALILLMIVTYFDRYTQMNAPHKLSQHMCILAALLALLGELRALIGRSTPQRTLPFSAFAAFLCITVGVSNTFAFALGSYEDITYLLFDLLLLTLGIRFAAACARVRPTSANSEVKK